MSDVPVQLIVAAFQDEKAADAALKELKTLKRERLIGIQNAAVIRKDEKGKVRIRETADLGGGRGAALGGVAGHAGLFSTAQDLARYAQMMLNDGKVGQRQILEPATIRTMADAYKVNSGLRGLGWDKRSGYSSNRGDGMSDRAFGHGGLVLASLGF